MASAALTPPGAPGLGRAWFQGAGTSRCRNSERQWRLLNPRTRAAVCSFTVRKARTETATTQDTANEDPAAQFLLARDKLTSSGKRSTQAEALISLVSAAVHAFQRKIKSLETQLSGEINGVKKIVYGLYIKAFLESQTASWATCYS